MKNLWLLFLGVVLFSCDGEVVTPTLKLASAYFPFEIGAYRDYEVEEITFNLEGPDTSNYFLREVFNDSIVSGQGDVRYLMQRFTSADQETWTLSNTWTARKVDQSIIVTEDNIDYLKLASPVALGTTWNGNSFNTLSTIGYYYAANTETVTALELPADSELIKLVIEDIEANLVNQDERYEWYAEGLGLIAKDYISLEFCTINCGELGEIQSGRILKQTLVAYGAL
ncbi:MAG: hypothetical protein ACJA2C_001972 [Marinoscillum sp.]|jgi:hypothetical protein